MSLRRRSLLGVVGDGLVMTAGCIEKSQRVAPRCVSSTLIQRPSRRSLLIGATAALPALAGCPLIPRWGGTGYADIEVANTTDEQYETTIHASGEIADFEATKTVEPDDTVLFEEAIPDRDHSHEFTLEFWLNDVLAHKDDYWSIHRDVYPFEITATDNVEPTFVPEDLDGG